VELQISTPPVQVRDQLKECKMDQIAFKNGVLSAQTWRRAVGAGFWSGAEESGAAQGRCFAGL